MPIIHPVVTADPMLFYPNNGRGAWPTSGTGGTLSLKGDVPGAFYRAPAGGGAFVMPGRTAYDRIRTRKSTNVNDYAVLQAVKAIQTAVGCTADGLFGSGTGNAVKRHQTKLGITADGIVGPATAKAMFKPLVLSTATKVNPKMVRLGPVTVGHMAWESRFDPGAVGYTTPNDIGIGQINGPAHPQLSVTDRLNPVLAITFVVNLVARNLGAFPSDERAGIAAYNLGLQGARNWVAAGCPDIYGKTDVKHYVDSVLAGI